MAAFQICNCDGQKFNAYAGEDGDQHLPEVEEVLDDADMVSSDEVRQHEDLTAAAAMLGHDVSCGSSQT